MSDFLRSICKGSQVITRTSTYGSAVPKKSACGSPSALSKQIQISLLSVLVLPVEVVTAVWRPSDAGNLLLAFGSLGVSLGQSQHKTTKMYHCNRAIEEEVMIILIPIMIVIMLIIIISFSFHS